MLLPSEDSESKQVALSTLEEPKRPKSEEDAQINEMQNKVVKAEQWQALVDTQRTGAQRIMATKRCPRPNPQNFTWWKCL